VRKKFVTVLVKFDFDEKEYLELDILKKKTKQFIEKCINELESTFIDLKNNQNLKAFHRKNLNPFLRNLNLILMNTKSFIIH
jgi:hypothetical protein